ESMEAFARLNALRFEDGLHLTFTRDAAPHAAFEIVHVSTGGPARVRYSRVVVEVERGASCTLVERTIGSEDGSGATHSVVDVRLDAGARLQHVLLGEDPGLSTRLV